MTAVPLNVHANWMISGGSKLLIHLLMGCFVITSFGKVNHVTLMIMWALSTVHVQG